jgi:phage/plasmid-like protein (TIGR03299 family)
MAHEIAFDKMFASVRVPAWHRLGKVVEQSMTPTEGLAAIGADFQIIKVPLMAAVPVAGSDAGMLTAIPERVALMREPVADDPEWRFINTVSAEYEVVSNRDITRIIDPLAERWPLETIGALGKGERIFLTLSLGDYEVGGDAIKEYFLVHNGTDGKTGLSLSYTPVRVVCQNTLTMGLSSARVSANMTHRAGVQDEMALRVGLLRDLQGAQLAGRAAFERLTEIALTTPDVDDLLARIFPVKTTRRETLAVQAEQAGEGSVSEGFRSILTSAKQAAESERENVMERRALVKRLYEHQNDTAAGAQGTAWSLYNATVEWADFAGRNSENTVAAALFGWRADVKEKAFALVSAHQPAPVVKPVAAAKRSRK